MRSVFRDFWACLRAAWWVEMPHTLRAWGVVCAWGGWLLWGAGVWLGRPRQGSSFYVVGLAASAALFVAAELIAARKP